MALAAFAASCTNADMEAELAARRARLDELEQQDYKVREVLYGKLNALRGKLLPIIEKVEADLKKKIDRESEKVEYALADSVAKINGRIDVAFAKAQSYIDQNMGACYDDIYDSFETLSRTKDAIHKRLGKAISDGDKNLEALLRRYESDVDKMQQRSNDLESRLLEVDKFFSEADRIQKLMDPMLKKSKDLEEVYSVMEENEADLLKKMNVLVSQEVLAELEINEINEMKGVLEEAENAIDNLESCKSDIEGYLSDSEGLFDRMEEISSFLDEDVLVYAQDIIEQGEDLRSYAEEYESYFSDFDPAAKLDEIEIVKEDMQTVFEELIDSGEVIASRVEEIAGDFSDLYNQMEDYWQNAWNWADETMNRMFEVGEILQDHPWIIEKYGL